MEEGNSSKKAKPARIWNALRKSRKSDSARDVEIIKGTARRAGSACGWSEQTARPLRYGWHGKAQKNKEFKLCGHKRKISEITTVLSARPVANHPSPATALAHCSRRRVVVRRET